jgi:hypothetical protein
VLERREGGEERKGEQGSEEKREGEESGIQISARQRYSVTNCVV